MSYRAITRLAKGITSNITILVYTNLVIHFIQKVSIIPTPGHMGRDVSVLVKGTSEGTVLVAGDLFERCHDEDSWKELSENPDIQETNRQKALQIADVIIPGHGPLFRVHKQS